MDRPTEKEYAPYYQKYISLIPNGDILQLMEKQNEQFCEFLAQFDEERANYRYAKGKWSIKEVIGHLIDVELVFMYRAWRFSRNDKASLHGFEQDEFIANSDFSKMTLSELVEQFYHMRKAAIPMFSSFSDEMWRRKGTANDSTFTVRAIAYIMVGHVIHHMRIIHQKYMKSVS